MASLAIFGIPWSSWLGSLIAVLLGIVIVAVIVIVARAVLSRIGRRSPWVAEIERRLRAPATTLGLVIALWIACGSTAPAREPWWLVVDRIFFIVMVFAAAWLLSILISFGFERLMKYDARLDDTSPEARRRQTQLAVLNRLAVMLISVLAIGIVLFSFPEMRAVGTSVLASAGIVSVVAGLAAQSTLGNLIAGIQVAFTDSIRVGDVVVVEGEWGTIGEINLSYVVVYIWDERRLILPCTYFTTNPIETWTRKSEKILGTVFMDLDWRVPVDAVREKFMEIIEASPAWDHRSANVLVTGSQGGYVTVRFKISAKNSDDQWDLLCLVREKIMTWLQQEHPEALPITRVAMEQPAQP